MAIVRAIEAFSYFDAAGVPRVVSPGQLFDSNDPDVVKRPTLFASVDSLITSTSTETATAAPGEVRALRSPIKRPAKAADAES